MLWKNNAKHAIKSGSLTAFIDEGSEIEGRYSFTGTVMLNGRFKGEIVSTGTLIVGDKAVVNASVQAAVVLINGEVNGNVSASERVELRGQARLFGDVDAPSVAIEEGVLFEGQCKMAKAKRSDNGVRESANGTSPNGARELSVVQMKR